jgi:predicted dienelactone hydrolase
MVMKIATLIAVLVGLVLLWQLSQNGRFEVVHLTSGLVLIVDTRDGDFEVSHVAPSSSGGVHVQYLRRAPAEAKSEARRWQDLLQGPVRASLSPATM